MKVKVELEEANNGQFSVIKLCYNDHNNNLQKVRLNIRDFSDAYDFAMDKTSKKFDFFLISVFVYGIDNLLNREIFSIDGWAREIEVEFPVINLIDFNGKESILEEGLKFLTGDYWKISFIKNTVKNHYRIKRGRWFKNIPKFDKSKIRAMSLFSGGLDSLIGVIDELEQLQENEKMVFVSHFDFESAGPNDDQTKLYQYLKSIYLNKIYWIQTKVALSRRDENKNDVSVESNYRSRSILFIGLGVYLSASENLIIPENGTITINNPLTPSRPSSLSTRTTHPFVINKFQEFITEIGLNNILINPYAYKTKGEMVSNTKGFNVFLGIYKESVSCGKRGHNRFWKNRTGTKHCGVCMPCIYRRSALNVSGLDNQLYGNDILNAQTLNDFMDMKALFSYLNRPTSLEKMKRDLLVNGSIPINELDFYAEMVLRSKEEVLSLFKNKGNEFVKSQLHLL